MSQRERSKVLHLLRDRDDFARLVSRCARRLGDGRIARFAAQEAVPGPAVPPEFQGVVRGAAPIVGVVSVWCAEPAAVIDPDPGAGEGYLVAERVMFHRTALEVGPEAAGAGFTRIGSQSRSTGLSRAAFDEHWRTRHGRLVEAHQPGVSRYVQNVVVRQLYGPECAVDGFHESYFADEEAYLEQLFDDDDGRRALAEDSRQLLRDPLREERVFTRPTAAVIQSNERVGDDAEA